MEKNTVPQQSRARSNDLTGRQRLAMQKEHAEEVARREGELTTIANEREVALASEVVDVTDPDRPEIIDSVEELPVGVDDEWRLFRVNEDLENVTIGVGNNYSFKAGQQVKAPRHVYENLNERGYVWH